QGELQALNVDMLIRDGRVGRFALQKAGLILSPGLREVSQRDEAFDVARWQIGLDSQSNLLQVWGYFAEDEGGSLEFFAHTGHNGMTLGVNRVVEMLQHADAYTHWVAEFARWLPLDRTKATDGNANVRLSNTQDASHF
ncbi:MAG: hypothetical protein AAGG44_20535, partial [Planctomycetota bacterium]